MIVTSIISQKLHCDIIIKVEFLRTEFLKTASSSVVICVHKSIRILVQSTHLCPLFMLYISQPMCHHGTNNHYSHTSSLQ